jgi:hypothetical protein
VHQINKYSNKLNILVGLKIIKLLLKEKIYKEVEQRINLMELKHLLDLN